MESVEKMYLTPEMIEATENSYVSESYYSQFMKEIQIKRVPEQTALDMIISYVAFIYDINFKYSCEVIEKESYIDGMLDAFDYKLDSTKVQIEEIREFAKNYLNRRLGK